MGRIREEQAEAENHEYMEKNRKSFEHKIELFQKFADAHGIKKLDPDILRDLEKSHTPAVLVRGKSITVEQVRQLITGEEPLFGSGFDYVKAYCPIDSYRSILGNIFYRPADCWLSTWVHSDGTIGGNLIFRGMFPEWDEMIVSYMCLAEKYPFLDLIVSYTASTYDFFCCTFCNILDSKDTEPVPYCACRDCQPYLDRIARYSLRGCRYSCGYDRDSDFEREYFRRWQEAHARSDAGNSVVLTIWVHNGSTDILFGREASDKFKEYNELYCAPEYEFMFSPYLYSYGGTCIFSKAFVEDCFEYIGKPRSLCDEYVEKSILMPFHEDSIAVTKEWITWQYKNYIEESILKT